jgi:flagellar basal-body rod protein FlgB
MDVSRIAVFDVAERRLAWAGRRQEVLAQNVANADTPDWRVRDVAPFATSGARLGAPVRTDPQHLSPREPGNAVKVIRTGERAPDGNAVALDVELAKVADTESIHEMATGLFGKYLAMFRIAAGR